MTRMSKRKRGLRSRMALATLAGKVSRVSHARGRLAWTPSPKPATSVVRALLVTRAQRRRGPGICGHGRRPALRVRKRRARFECAAAAALWIWRSENPTPRQLAVGCEPWLPIPAWKLASRTSLIKVDAVSLVWSRAGWNWLGWSNRNTCPGLKNPDFICPDHFSMRWALNIYDFRREPSTRLARRLLWGGAARVVHRKP